MNSSSGAESGDGEAPGNRRAWLLNVSFATYLLCNLDDVQNLNGYSNPFHGACFIASGL